MESCEYEEYSTHHKASFFSNTLAMISIWIRAVSKLEGFAPSPIEDSVGDPAMISPAMVQHRPNLPIG